MGAGRRHKTDIVGVDAAVPQSGVAATKLTAELVSKEDTGKYGIPDASSSVKAMGNSAQAAIIGARRPGCGLRPWLSDLGGLQGALRAHVLVHRGMLEHGRGCGARHVMNVRTTIMILLCVGFTMVDVMGCVKVWGLAVFFPSLLAAFRRSWVFCCWRCRRAMPFG